MHSQTVMCDELDKQAERGGRKNQWAYKRGCQQISFALIE